MNRELEIETLTTAILDGYNAIESGRNAYLRALVAETQETLGAPARVRPGKVPRLSPEGITLQLTALQTAQDKLYAVVMRVAGARYKGKELNRKTNFARTRMYLLRTWIKSANDITALAAARVTAS